MLRERDYLLTLAAIWLLFAALESSSRSKLVIAASAARAEAAVDNQQTQASDRATSQMMQVDLFMSKIKKNIDNQQQHSARRVTNQDKRQDRQLNDQHLNHLDVDTIGGHQRRLAGGAPGERENNSYNYYANEAGQQQAATNNNNRQVPGRLHQFKEAHGVRVHFLRTKQDDHRRPHSSVDSPPTELQGNTTNNILYLLNEHSPAASEQSHLPRQPTRPGGSSLDDVARSLEPRADNEPLSTAAQQQPPPFTMFAPGGASANGLADQQQNIRQILANYQRGGVGLPQLTDQQRQLLTQLQPRPPELHLRPPTTPAPALPALAGLLQPQSPPPPPPPAQQQQQQQPFSPLQLLTGPLQAFLPGLGQQPGQQQQPPVANVNNQQKPSDGTGQPATVPGAPNGQAPAQFNLLNPFNLPQMQGPTAGGSGQPRPPASGLANLQDFYQQLPLYQALLAARQRQEALQAAQRMRQQQQQHQANGAYRNPLMPPQQQQLNPLMPQPPGQSVHNGAGNQNGWTPPAANQQQQHPPANRPTSNQAGPVQFDDDQEQQQPPPPPSPQAPVNNNQQQQPQHHENNNNDQSDDSGADQNNNQNNDNSGQNNNNSNNNDHGGNEQHHQPGPEQGGGGGKAEEEDPDLKSFQNLANGGDDFAGLFPPGILSNNDINEIKTQQAEQAKKQEQEERQKQQQQQQQQFQQPAAGQQQHDNQPMNQFANGGNQQQQEQQQSPNALNENNNDGAQDDNNQQEQPDDNQEDSEQGNGEGEESPQEGDGDQQQEDAPSAAALTAKSSSSSETTDDDGDDGRRQKFTKSPGVEYATTTTDKTKHKNMKTTK